MPVSHAVFKYASNALSYEFMSHDATVSHSDFVDNVAAIEVEETSGPDYKDVGDLPCVPPWLDGVVADDSWFGPHGHPAPDLDLASFVGAVIPATIPIAGRPSMSAGSQTSLTRKTATLAKAIRCRGPSIPARR